MRHRVFELAEREGWTMRELADRMDLSESYISRVRSGERPVRWAFMNGARRAWPDMPLDYLFPRDAAQPA